MKSRQSAFAAVVLLGVFSLAGCLFKKMSEELNSIAISMPDLSSSRDGVYRGRHETALIKAEVELEIRDGMIITARIINHDCGRGKDAEAVLEDVVEIQSVEADTVAGATGSSKVILKAAEKAVRASLLN